MSTFLRSLVLAVAVLTSASAAMAAPSFVPDQSDRYGGYAPDSQQGQRAFWDYQTRRGP